MRMFDAHPTRNDPDVLARLLVRATSDKCKAARGVSDAERVAQMCQWSVEAAIQDQFNETPAKTSGSHGGDDVG